MINIERFAWRPGDIVMEGDEEKGVKYSPDQPRDDWGRFGSAARPPSPKLPGAPRHGAGHPIIRTANSNLWGASHSYSSEITGSAAKVMGIPGYRDPAGELNLEAYNDTPETRAAVASYEKQTVGVATDFLGRIAGDKLGSEEPLYHGFANKVGVDFQVGDTLRVPLLASCGSQRDAEGYGVRLDARDQVGEPTVFKFPVGTPMMGYAKWDPTDEREFGHVWSEAVVAGGFRVSDVKVEPNAFRGERSLRTVTLQPTETFDPTTNQWRPVSTELLDG